MLKRNDKTPLIISLNILMVLIMVRNSPAVSQATQPMTDTGQIVCYSNNGEIPCPKEGRTFYGQDAQYESNLPSYTDNGDGTVTDLVTGLTWSKAVNETKVSLLQAHNIAKHMNLGGYTDWRIPTIKELYSLMNFSGKTGFNGRDLTSRVPSDAIPYINTDYFEFRYGNITAGERYIDAQWLSSTKYVSTTMNGAKTLFGVNFADGRIKGYGYSNTHGNRPEKKFYVRYVRGKSYGNNDFSDNGDGTITDLGTGLMWMKADSGKGMNWKDALIYAQTIKTGGYDDWRLPNAKELQFIVDYNRSPDTTNSAAIDPVFDISTIKNEQGQKDYPYFWTSTTHLDGPKPGNHAVYISFGRGMGQMRGKNMDVHGAGSQRSDPKSGSGNMSRGPQGDWVRVFNYVRLVRGGSVTERTALPIIDKMAYPNSVKITDTASTTFKTTNQKQNMPQQSQHTGSGGKRFINHLDSDGDGKVSKSEFDGPSHHFPVLDKNNDGYISEDEAPEGPSRK